MTVLSGSLLDERLLSRVDKDCRAMPLANSVASRSHLMFCRGETVINIDSMIIEMLSLRGTSDTRTIARRSCEDHVDLTAQSPPSLRERLRSSIPDFAASNRSNTRRNTSSSTLSTDSPQPPAPRHWGKDRVRFSETGY